jgi:hypothetical protein
VPSETLSNSGCLPVSLVWLSNWLAISSGTAQGEAGKGSVLREVAVPSLLFVIAISEEAPGGCDRLDGPAQAFGDDQVIDERGRVLAKHRFATDTAGSPT